MLQKDSILVWIFGVLNNKNLGRNDLNNEENYYFIQEVLSQGIFKFV